MRKTPILIGGLVVAGMAALTGLWLSGFSGQRFEANEPAWGFNLLQSRESSFAEEPARAALRRLAELGADHVAVVTFLEQAAPDAAEPSRGGQVTDEQLVAALRAAHAAGLETLVKPQLLVPGSWAGEIDPPSRKRWFGAYGDHLLRYARIAEREGAEALVIGTELTKLGGAEEWKGVIAAVRREYSGKLTYAAHNAEGVEAFAHWEWLDAVGMTLYPSLGQTARPPAVRAHMTKALDRVEAAVTGLDLPVWVLEIGHPSATGSLPRPWDWRRLAGPGVEPNPGLQAMVLQEWIGVLRERPTLADNRVARATFWSWYGTLEAGGYGDTGFTVQNKPAQVVLQCHWRGCCREGTGAEQ
ncbi:glycoside hydrolase family 113 [Thiohalorhabdus methylotrophus]|uniref:Glycosidase-like protein n=1 Tax=Thiohalorhabdus methylotrophus TaxID=3242694 RepID=A0ABV4TS21_9GAMM